MWKQGCASLPPQYLRLNCREGDSQVNSCSRRVWKQVESLSMFARDCIGISACLDGLLLMSPTFSLPSILVGRHKNTFQDECFGANELYRKLTDAQSSTRLLQELCENRANSETISGEIHLKQKTNRSQISSINRLYSLTNRWIQLGMRRNAWMWYKDLSH